MSDQGELFWLVASVPTAWRMLAEITRVGARADRRIALPQGRRAGHAQPVGRRHRLAPRHGPHLPP
jgi:hypothetical protein